MHDLPNSSEVPFTYKMSKNAGNLSELSPIRVMSSKSVSGSSLLVKISVIASGLWHVPCIFGKIRVFLSKFNVSLIDNRRFIKNI